MTDTTRPWAGFALVALFSLTGVAAAVFLAGITPALLLGWAVGAVAGATALLLRPRR